MRWTLPWRDPVCWNGVARVGPPRSAPPGRTATILGGVIGAFLSVPMMAQPRSPDTVTDTVLTVTTLTQLTTFWTAFAAEPDSVRRPQLATWGTDRPPLLILDTVFSGPKIDRMELVQNVTALAARYSSVAAALARASLTGPRYHVLLATLLNTCRTFNGVTWGNPVTPTPLEATNIAVLRSHRQAFDALVKSAGWDGNTDDQLHLALVGQQRLGIGDCIRMAQIVDTSAATVDPSLGQR